MMSAIERALELEEFAFSYPSDEEYAANGNRATNEKNLANEPRPFLGPLSWEVATGSFCLLVGQTGSGKTTLLKNLVPALAPAGRREGSIRLFGTPADTLDARSAATTVGYVAQNPDSQLVCDAVWHELAFGLENLGMPQDAMHRRVAEVAHFFGMEPWLHSHVAELSGGRKQIAALAAALALRPSLLLLDEPTSQLDPIAEQAFLHELFRVNRQLGITVVVATHAPESLVDYATHAACLNAGCIEPCKLEDFRARPLDLAARANGASSQVGASYDAPSETPKSSSVASLAARLRSKFARAAPSKGHAACVEGPAANSSSAQPAIVLDDAYLRYRAEDDWVLRGFDLAIAEGSIHALLGGNGCGKSTLLHAIAGVRKLERGQVRNRLAARQALLPQNPKALLVCDSVAEELAEWQATCGYSDDDIAAMAQSFGLSKSLGTHPFDLSGGQQQLLALAKLLLTKPSLLLLDEPTKGLDPQAKLIAAQHILQVAHSGVTVVAATHDLSFAALICDKVTLMFDGENAATQTPEDFFADNLFYQPIYDRFASLWLEQAGERHA